MNILKSKYSRPIANIRQQLEEQGIDTSSLEDQQLKRIIDNTLTFEFKTIIRKALCSAEALSVSTQKLRKALLSFAGSVVA